MARASTRIGVAIGGAAMLAACTLFTDFSGLGGEAEPTPLPDRSTPDDTQGDAPKPIEDSGGVAPDSGPYHPKYERAATITNNAASDLLAGSTQCFLDKPPIGGGGDGSVVLKFRPDLGDVRVFGPKTERIRVIDVRRGGYVSVCFSLERAIPPGGSETYLIFYGDPNATPPPPAEPTLFAFWEDFNGSTLSTQRWSVLGAATVGSGMLTLPKGQNAVATKAGQDEIPAVASLEIRARITDPVSKGSAETDGGTEFFWWLGFQRKGDFAAGAPWSLFIGRSPGSVRAEHKTITGPCSTLDCGTPSKAQDAEFRVYRIDRKTQQTELIDDEGTSHTGEGTNGDESVMIRNWLANSELVVDWVRARPIADPAPSLVVGPEELVP